MTANEVKSEAHEVVGTVVAHRRHLHQHPELSFKEYKTSEYVRSVLKKHGIAFESMVETGVVATIVGKSEGKNVALRADLDALPIQETNECDYASTNTGIMHACGHDVHTASLLGVAEILHKSNDKWSGSVKLIFQPGEEKLPGGASLMIKAGVLKNPVPDSIFGQHVFPDLASGKVGFRAGPYMASADEIYMKVKGKGGHAALPHYNVDPIIIAAEILISLQQVVSRRSNPLTPTVLSFGKIKGEGATNVIPDEVIIEGTLRTFDEKWRFEAHDLIRTMAQSMAKGAGGDCEVEIKVGYPFVNNHESLTRAAMKDAIELLGEEQVVMLDQRMTAEDFAFYGQHVPACFYRLGTRNGADGPLRNIHTSTFDIDESSLETSVALMTWLALKELER